MEAARACENYTQHFLFFHGRTVEQRGLGWGARRRKLLKAFYNDKKQQFDISKVPDIYDSAKYDAIHNSELGLTLKPLYAVRARARSDPVRLCMRAWHAHADARCVVPRCKAINNSAAACIAAKGLQKDAGLRAPVLPSSAAKTVAVLLVGHLPYAVRVACAGGGTCSAGLERSWQCQIGSSGV